MTKRWISIWIVLLAVMLGAKSHAAGSGQAIGAEVDGLPSWVLVDKLKVHPTQLLARLKVPGVDDALKVLLRKNDMQLRTVFTLVPGLLLIEVNNEDGTVKSANDYTKRLTECLNVLEKSGVFRYVEYDGIDELGLLPNDQALMDGRLWGLINNGQNNGLAGADIKAGQAWDITTGSGEVIVGVLDTGVRYTHQDLADQMWINEDEIPLNGVDDDNDGYVDNVYGINGDTGSGDPMDIHGHGTHCSGTIAAAANDGNPHVGVAWNVRIMALKAGNFFIAQSAQAAGIQFAADHGVRIINGSFGGPGFSQAMFDVYSAGGDEGMIFAICAQNYTSDNDLAPIYPASYDLECIISVAATDRNDQLSTFSNYGVVSVDLGAPGTTIFSCTADADDSYENYDGTSMATPHVAGVLALMQSLQPNWSVLQFREKLFSSLDTIPSLQGVTSTGGRLNAFKAVQGMGGASALPDGIMEVSVKPSSGSVLLADTDQPIFVTVIDGEPVTDAVVIGILDDGTEMYFNNDGDFPDVQEKDNVYSYYLPLPEEPRKMRLTLVITAPNKEEYLRVVKYDIVPVPENDHFADAAKLPPLGGVVEAFNTFATMENGEPKHSGLTSLEGSLWWNWSPAESGTLHLDISGSDIQGVLSVYYGTSFVNVIELASNYPLVGIRPSYIQFPGIKGKTYRIVVASLGEDTKGYIRLRAEVNGQPDINPPYVSVTSPPNGLVTTEKRVELTGHAVDSVPNSSGIAEVIVRVNNRIGVTAIGAEEWKIPVVLDEGLNRVEVYAVDYSNNISKPYRMEIDHRPPDIPNDHFTNATRMNRDYGLGDGVKTQFPMSQPLTDLEEILVKVNGRLADRSGFNVFEFNTRVLEFSKAPADGAEVEVFHPSWTSQPVNTDDATRETGEPQHSGNEGGGSVWWAFTAPYDGVLNVSTVNTKIDTVMGAYVGARVNQLRVVTSNDDDLMLAGLEDNPGYSRITQALEKGMTLMVAVDGFGNSRGELAIISDFKSTQVHELSVSTENGGVLLSPWLPFGSEKEGWYAIYEQDANVTLKAKADEGNEFYGWQGSVNSLENPLYLVVTGKTSVQATFGPQRLTDDFESGEFDRLSWQNTGEAGWFIQKDIVDGGIFALQSGSIGDKQSSSIKVHGEFNGGRGSFSSRVDSEENWDKLVFLIDDRVVREWSGLVEWNNFEFNITSGRHELEWRYEKDFANKDGVDAAWLDNVDLPLTLAGSIGLVPVGDEYRIRVWGRSGHRYEVQVSDDLIHWEPVESVIIGRDGVADLPGNITISEGEAFYRVLAP